MLLRRSSPPSMTMLMLLFGASVDSTPKSLVTTVTSKLGRASASWMPVVPESMTMVSPGFTSAGGALADAAFLVEVRGALGLVGRFRRGPADHFAVDAAAVGPRHDAALGKETQVLANGLHADAKSFGERRHLYAAVLADEFTDLQAALAGIAGCGHRILLVKQACRISFNFAIDAKGNMY